MTKDEYIAQAVAEAREKAEASWKTAVRREKYRQGFRREDPDGAGQQRGSI